MSTCSGHLGGGTGTRFFVWITVTIAAAAATKTVRCKASHSGIKINPRSFNAFVNLIEDVPMYVFFRIIVRPLTSANSPRKSFRKSSAFEMQHGCRPTKHRNGSPTRSRLTDSVLKLEISNASHRLYRAPISDVRIRLLPALSEAIRILYTARMRTLFSLKISDIDCNIIIKQLPVLTVDCFPRRMRIDAATMSVNSFHHDNFVGRHMQCD
jgi:hypothetical protein